MLARARRAVVNVIDATIHYYTEAYIVYMVCKDLQEQGTSQIRRMDFIQEKQLADPLTGESGQVDMLLDIADSYRCYLTNMARTVNSKRSRPSLAG